MFYYDSRSSSENISNAYKDERVFQRLLQMRYNIPSMRKLC